MSTKRNLGRSTVVRPPSSGKKTSSRALFAVLLTVLLPPVGIVYLWRQGVFRTNGRALLTGLATVEMLVLFLWMMPGDTVSTATPLPVNTQRTTPAPESDALTALSNIDELLRARQIEDGTYATQAPSAVELLQQAESERDAVLNTVVYAVYGAGARYYHVGRVCGNQSNNRELTVREAMSEGLGACPDCNPPIYGFVASTDAP